MVNGRDLMTGLPRQVEISDHEIHLAFKDIIQSILDAIKSCLEKTPPELALPVGSATGSPAPIAAAIGSSMI